MDNVTVAAHLGGTHSASLLHSIPDVSKIHYGNDECPSRHTVTTIYTLSNGVDAPPRNIPVGLPVMMDAEHRPVHREIHPTTSGVRLTSSRPTNSGHGHLGIIWEGLDNYAYLFPKLIP